jgi:hypothetical protein
VLWVLHCRTSTIPAGYTQKEVAFQAGPAGRNFFASLRRVSPVQVTGRSYAWMTDVRGFDPGGTFVRIPHDNQGSVGGNRFDTLQKK